MQQILMEVVFQKCLRQTSYATGTTTPTDYLSGKEMLFGKFLELNFRIPGIELSLSGIELSLSGITFISGIKVKIQCHKVKVQCQEFENA